MRLTVTRAFFAMVLLAWAAVPTPAQARKVQGFENTDPNNFTSIGDVGKVGTFQTQAPSEGTMQLLLTTVGMTSNEDSVPSQSGTFAVGSAALQSFFNGVAVGGFEGSAVLIPFTVSAGDTLLTFNYDFLSNEPFATPKRNDFAFAAIFDAGNALKSGVTTVADVSTSTFNLFQPQTPFIFHTGYQPPLAFSLAALAPGNYTLGVGVADFGSADHASALLIDNVQIVPEPSIAALSLIGAGLLIAVRRRIQAA
jgi:hypothetical protein